jgi:hypothetical protein
MTEEQEMVVHILRGFIHDHINTEPTRRKGNTHKDRESVSKFICKWKFRRQFRLDMRQFQEILDALDETYPITPEHAHVTKVSSGSAIYLQQLQIADHLENAGWCELLGHDLVPSGCRQG